MGDNNKGVLGVVDLVDGHVEAEVTLDVPDASQYVHVDQLDVTADGSRVLVLLNNNGRYKVAAVEGRATPCWVCTTTWGGS